MLLGAIGSGMMPAPKSADVVPGSVVSVVRMPSSFTLAACACGAATSTNRLRLSARARPSKTEACRATYRDA